jgi:pimeloyl-ACP methyl ester carboxylesterase
MGTAPIPARSFESGTSEVNGLSMYHEIHGSGEPIVLIHGGGSTIGTTFGRIIPILALSRKVIAVELQAHGRTSDRNADLTFEQDADDVAELLKNIGIVKADFFGFSNGGTSAIQVAIRHPNLINKLILGSALISRDGVPAQFWDFMKNASLENMPIQLQEAYKQVAPDPSLLKIMHDRDAKRMVNFRDLPEDDIRSIKVSTLIINGDKDVIAPEHAIKLHRLLPNSQLAIVPGLHGEYIGEITTLHTGSKQWEYVLPMVERFLG